MKYIGNNYYSEPGWCDALHSIHFTDNTSVYLHINSRLEDKRQFYCFQISTPASLNDIKSEKFYGDVPRKEDGSVNFDQLKEDMLVFAEKVFGEEICRDEYTVERLKYLQNYLEEKKEALSSENKEIKKVLLSTVKKIIDAETSFRKEEKETIFNEVIASLEDEEHLKDDREQIMRDIVRTKDEIQDLKQYLNLDLNGKYKVTFKCCDEIKNGTFKGNKFPDGFIVGSIETKINGVAYDVMVKIQNGHCYLTNKELEASKNNIPFLAGYSTNCVAPDYNINLDINSNNEKEFYEEMVTHLVDSIWDVKLNNDMFENFKDHQQRELSCTKNILKYLVTDKDFSNDKEIDTTALDSMVDEFIDSITKE